MAASLDLDQLRTFVAIAETGSFTRAGDVVFKTQSAVSMQMRRLEERIGKPIFARDGRASRLTEEGERLLAYARRIVRLADETVAAFDDTELSGSIRLGTPDDYADRFLPEVLARFSRSNPRVEVTVTCEPSNELFRQAAIGEVDLAIVTACGAGPVEVVRQEPLLWVGSAQHDTAAEEVLPLALSKAPCMWRDAAVAALTGVGRRYRVLYQSSNATAVSAAVLAGLAVSVLAESALRRGMRVLGEADGLPRLPNCEIGIIRAARRADAPIVKALAEHIVSSLDNLSVRVAAE
jgi:DNA-binding transcriptional LysR family regulator